MSDENKIKPIARPGKNCWRKEEADRLKLFYDSAGYFKAFYEAAQKARHSMFIIGWDIHSHLKLIRDEEEDGLEFPVKLGPFLNSLVEQNRNLCIFVLVWDFAMIYLFEREIFPVINFDWKTHRRVRFKLDSYHPIGASQHQKIVVIDDQLAFTGGIDLGPRRWDTEDHIPDDSRRRDPDGEPYPPFHDMQIMIEGPAARAIGDIARDRWKRATGNELKKCETASSPWPGKTDADLKRIPLSIARTYPRWRDYPEIKEVEKLHLDSIKSAEEYIFIENQYLTSTTICETLEKKLKQKEGPEIIIITTRRQDGWIEENTMGILRYRFMSRLEKADRHGRLMILYPAVIKMSRETLIAVHAKIMIIDGRFFRVGSANLSNRSMGVDSECDIAIEPEDNGETGDKINEILWRRLSSHLSVSVEEAAAQIKKRGSLIEAIKNLRGNERSLHPLKIENYSFFENIIPEENPADPAEPINVDILLEKLRPEKEQASKYGNIAKLLIPLVILLVLGAVWQWSGLKHYIQPDKIAPYIEPFKEGLTGFLAVIGIYTAGSILMIPLTLMIVLTALVFGPLTGFLYAMAGSIISAYFTFLIGKFLWRDAIRKIVGDKLNALNSKLKKQSILVIAALRIVPVAPFTVVNMVAGSSRIKLQIYMSGTVIGMIPGVLALTIFSDRAYNAFKHPDFISIAIAAAILLVLIVAGNQVKKYVKKFFNTDRKNAKLREQQT